MLFKLIMQLNFSIILLTTVISTGCLNRGSDGESDAIGDNQFTELDYENVDGYGEEDEEVEWGEVQENECDNLYDDDGDTLIDCNDSDCFSSPACMEIICIFDSDCPDGYLCVCDRCVNQMLVWPNIQSSANSDRWLVEHHDEILQIRPKVMLLNFVNSKTNDQMLIHAQKVVDAMKEASRWHGYKENRSCPFLFYQLSYAIDLRDNPPPPDWHYRNSTLYPRENPQTGLWGFDYETLFTTEFSSHYGVVNPDAPDKFLDLCELFSRGYVNEVWIYMDADVPDAGAAEILELKPYYDENFVRIMSREMNRCAGNGCFDVDDEIPTHCTNTIRIAAFNNTRGAGCFLESLSHGFESIGAWNPDILPYLSKNFIPFANYRLNERYGIPFDSWYSCPYDTTCYYFPSETSIEYNINGQTGTIDPYDPVCGNVHFPPNARKHYDLESPYTVQTTCEGFGLGEGVNGKDKLYPFTSQNFTQYWGLAPDCMGPFLIWWRQNFPSRGGIVKDVDGKLMKNWWPFIYY